MFPTVEQRIPVGLTTIHKLSRLHGGLFLYSPAPIHFSIGWGYTGKQFSSFAFESPPGVSSSFSSSGYVEQPSCTLSSRSQQSEEFARSLYGMENGLLVLSKYPQTYVMDEYIKTASWGNTNLELFSAVMQPHKEHEGNPSHKS